MARASRLGNKDVMQITALGNASRPRARSLTPERITNTPLPTSRTATRAHFQPFALARQSKGSVPNWRVFAST